MGISTTHLKPPWWVSDFFLPVATPGALQQLGESRSFTWRTSSDSLPKHLQQRGAKCGCGGEPQPKSPFLNKPRDKKKLAVKSLTCFFSCTSFLKEFFFSRWCWDFVEVFLWKTLDGQNPRKSMDMANIWYSQSFIRLIWSTGFCPQLVAASLEKWFSTWRIIPLYKCFINMVSKFTNGGY